MTSAELAKIETRVAALEAGYDTYAWLVGVILSVLTLTIIVFGLVSFAYFRHIAERRARDQARETSVAVAERETNRYLENQLPSILASHGVLKSEATGDEGDAIAAHPE